MELQDNDNNKTKAAEVEDINTSDKSTLATGIEGKDETILETVKREPWAVLWCCYAIWVVLVVAFDFAAPSAILSVPQFRKDFGYYYEGNYVLPAKWQSAYSGAPVASGVIGSFLSGWLADKIGKKLMITIAYVLILAGISIEMVATTNPIFFVAKFIIGFAIGIGLAVSFSYIGEVAPLKLRGIIAAAGGLAFIVAQLTVAIIQNGISARNDRWAYRGIFVAQYGITFFGIVFLPFMPESPYWLVSRENDAKTTRSLRRLGYSPTDITKHIADMKITLEKARQETSTTSYLECFRKSNLRRTIIAVAPLFIQNISGYYFVGSYLTYYAQLVGYSTHASFIISILAQVASFIGCVISCFLIDRVGRRALNIWGLGTMTVVMFVAGGLGTTTNFACLKGVVALFIVFEFIYFVTIGATGFVSLAEIATPRLRTKTAALGILVQNAIVCVLAFVIPYLFNPDKGNLGGKTGFIFGFLALVSTVYLFLYHPETAGRSYREIDEMFITRVNAREFKGYVTEAEVLDRREVGQVSA
ncbi:general substrate transporter [Aspergillus pseudoustus]|uniref:General substrate transporter n=1 Tax=Aspergillus pseudoustus TaxID=1810923 RepID=A0ABR4JFN4_9EURO